MLWNFEPSVVIGCILVAAAYLWWARFRLDAAAFYFLLGVALTFLALTSPLDSLGDESFFSVHMIQHILLAMVAPVFFVLGLTPRLLVPLLRRPWANLAERRLGAPWTAWSLGTFTLFVWHIPVLYNATLENDGIHAFEHLTFLVTGTIFWWPVFAPPAHRRLAPLGALVYLTAAGLANSVLGIVFTIATQPFYTLYAHPHDSDFVRRLRESWGLDPVTDQQLGGALMWVGGSVIFFWAIMVVVARWLKESEPAHELEA